MSAKVSLDEATRYGYEKLKQEKYNPAEFCARFKAIYDDIVSREPNPAIRLLMTIAPVEILPPHPEITAFTTEDYRIYINSALLKGLLEKYKENYDSYTAANYFRNDVKALILHEQSHVLMEHIIEGKTIAEKYKTKLNQMQTNILSNIIQDYIINKWVVEKYFEGLTSETGMIDPKSYLANSILLDGGITNIEKIKDNITFLNTAGILPGSNNLSDMYKTIEGMTEKDFDWKPPFEIYVSGVVPNKNNQNLKTIQILIQAGGGSSSGGGGSSTSTSNQTNNQIGTGPGNPTSNQTKQSSQANQNGQGNQNSQNNQSQGNQNAQGNQNSQDQQSGQGQLSSSTADVVILSRELSQGKVTPEELEKLMEQSVTVQNGIAGDKDKGADRSDNRTENSSLGERLGMRREELEQIIDKVMETLSGMTAGTVPAGLRIYIDKWKKKRMKRNWQKFVRMTVDHYYGKRVYSDYKRPSRRLGDDFPYTRFQSKANRAFILVDTSGSMDAESITTCADIANEMRKHNVESYIICWDADVYPPLKIRTESDIKRALGNLRGGGGTVIKPALEDVAKRVKPRDVVFIVSDMYISDLESQDVKQTLTEIRKKTGNTILVYNTTKDYKVPQLPGCVVFNKDESFIADTSSSMNL